MREFRPVPFLPAVCLAAAVLGGEAAAQGPARRLDPGAVAPLVREAAAEAGLDSRLVDAVIRVESAYEPFAVSPAGAAGLMQLMPATAARFGVINRFDPRQNVFAGCRYLAWLLGRFGGDVRIALAAYNAGEGAVDRYGGVPPWRETRRFVQAVLSRLSAVP